MRHPTIITAVATVLFCVSILITWFIFVLYPPQTFPTEGYLEIEAGSTLTDIAHQLQDEAYIRSSVAFTIKAFLQGDATRLRAGRYTFSEEQTVQQLLSILTNGDNRNSLVRVTHIEGRRVDHLAETAASILVDFDAEYFTKVAQPYEGMLFPDTYYVPETFTADELFSLLHEQYHYVVDSMREEIESHPLDETEIIILASILEREANSVSSKRMVSGILQNRLAIQMPLQADATLEYVLEKPLSDLTAEDLEIDSPYNTYLYNGLPPTAIGNPGRNAIEAVLFPIETDYFYYITGRDGQFYYAEDFDTHRNNIQRYLRL